MFRTTSYMATAKEGRRGHRMTLVFIFFAWKILLLTLATFCPGPGYDTSALILVDPSVNRHKNFTHLPWPDRLTLKLFRWDALYFVKGAQRGKVHEQEWAFSWAYSWFLGIVGQLDSASKSKFELQQYIVAGIVLSNICHLLSVFALYQLLTITVGSQQRHHIAFIGAVLHVMTSASLFLSAPYTEAPFSLLNLAGMLLYAQSRLTARTQYPSLLEDVYTLGSGICFAFATLIRSNGLLSGLLLLYDVARYLPRVVSMQLNVHDVRRIIVTCMSGSIIALGLIWPQYLAYTQFCAGAHGSYSPPWCMKVVPSIYSWVQSHYWNVGLFHYWTLSNVPLFLIAAPMLRLLFVSSMRVLDSQFQPPDRGRPVPRSSVTADSRRNSAVVHHVPELALPQLVLAIMAVTSFHVQVINRLASGYPTWYMMVATWLVDEQKVSSSAKHGQRSPWVIRGMITYAIVQGMLFANFLPPA